MNHKPGTFDPGVGATKDLSLRLSVASLVRVLFENPQNGELMLALERRATLLDDKGRRFVDIKSQPFGGALQIRDLKRLQDKIGDFHFDSEHSRSAHDFRLFIQPSAWPSVRQFCLQQFVDVNDGVLESDPHRELTEEFAVTLGIRPGSEQYTYRPLRTILESAPAPTENFFARGSPTARIYRVFEARVLDPSLAQAMIVNHERFSNEDLQKLALDDDRMGGHGWVSTVLTLRLDQISAFYFALVPETRARPVLFHGHRLDETVAAILDDIPVPKYQRLPEYRDR